LLCRLCHHTHLKVILRLAGPIVLFRGPSTVHLPRKRLKPKTVEQEPIFGFKPRHNPKKAFRLYNGLKFCYCENCGVFTLVPEGGA
jgi:hypothetical protein